MGLKSRILQKIFGSSGGSTEFGQVGSDAAGSAATTKDLDTIQSLTQYLGGLYSITDSANEPPRIQDINALYFLITSQLSYLFQAGIPEWITTEEYFANISYVQVSGVIYISLTGTNLSPNTGNNPTTDTTNWRRVYTQAEYIDSSGTESTINLKQVVVEIGPWDMDTDTSILITHHLPYSKIVSFSVTIIDDYGQRGPLINSDNTAGAYAAGGMDRVLGPTTIYLHRLVSEHFDTVNYSSSTKNRGYIVALVEV